MKTVLAVGAVLVVLYLLYTSMQASSVGPAKGGEGGSHSTPPGSGGTAAGSDGGQGMTAIDIYKQVQAQSSKDIVPVDPSAPRPSGSVQREAVAFQPLIPMQHPITTAQHQRAVAIASLKQANPNYTGHV